MQQPSKKRKDKHERNKRTRRYYNYKSRQSWRLVIVDVKDDIKGAER